VEHAGANVIDHNAPVFATLFRCSKRASLDLSGPSALDIALNLVQTGQKFSGKRCSLIRPKCKRLLQKTTCRIRHDVILHQHG